MKNSLCLIVSLFVALPALAWDWWPLPMAAPDTCHDRLFYVGQINILSSSGTEAPYLLQTNRHGTISSAPHSGSLALGIIKPATRPNRWFDYDFAAVLAGRLQSSGTLGTGYFEQLYAHARLYIVDLTIGIRPHSFAADPELTMGHFLFSDNAHPVPRISIGFDRWTPIPGLYGYLDIKGGLTHGWLDDNNPFVSRTYLNHAYVAGRVGGKLPLNISYEFHHAAQWGGHSATAGDLGNRISDFWHILTAQKSGGTTRNETLGREGNHIGMQQLTVTVKGTDWHIDFYWQYINEDGPLRFIGGGKNNRDGIWGAHFEQTRWSYLQAFTLEFTNTTDQSGPFHDKDGIVFGGDDSYFANGVYAQGWTYFSRTIGLPLITQMNNRVMAGYFGVKGDIYGFRYRFVAQHTENWGTYRMPSRSHNTALMLEVQKHVEKAWGMDFSISLASDIGNQFGNTFGALITIRKQGLITTIQ